MLFSDIERTNSSPKGYTDNTFEHLDQRAGAPWDRVRDLLDEWFSHLPSDDQHGFQNHVRSRKDVAFHSSFLELFVHELLLKLGHHVEVHPKLAGTKKKPDFKALAPDSSETFIECTVVFEETDEERSAQARLDALLDAINKLDSPDFLLGLETRGFAKTPVPTKRWCCRIQDWIETLDYDDIMAGVTPDWYQSPKLRLPPHDGLTLTVGVIPKKQSARGKPGARTIGVQSTEAVFVTSHRKIRDKIEKKAARYGELHLPYVLVVNCLGVNADEEEIQEALYGYGGVWASTASASFTRLSAVLAVVHLLPWSIPRVDLRLFHNPHAKFRYAGPLTDLPQVELVDGNKKISSGAHPRTYFGLDAEWPRKLNSAM